jgi:hypothetical protein
LETESYELFAWVGLELQLPISASQVANIASKATSAQLKLRILYPAKNIDHSNNVEVMWFVIP